MKNKRRIHSSKFKARVALAAIKGIKTVQEIAADNQVHPTQVTQGKSPLLAVASEVFGPRAWPRNTEEAVEQDKERFERKIG